jgi:hypothetical protein
VTETNVFQLSQPGTFSDPLTEVLRNGARALLAQAVEAEVSSLLSCHADKLTDDGRRRLVRHGHLPEREIMTGIGPIAVRCPRVRDRGGEGSERIRFLSTILPPYARRSKIDRWGRRVHAFIRAAARRDRNGIECGECQETGKEPADMRLPCNRLLDPSHADRAEPEPKR